MGCDWRLVASRFNPSSGITVIHTLRRFYIFMHRTTISHFSCKQGFPTQSRGQHSHGPRFSNKKHLLSQMFSLTSTSLSKTQ